MLLTGGGVEWIGVVVGRGVRDGKRGNGRVIAVRAVVGRWGDNTPVDTTPAGIGYRTKALLPIVYYWFLFNKS